MLTFACWWMRGAAGGRGAGGSLSYMRGHGTEAGQVPLSDAQGCDSRGVRALAYITASRIRQAGSRHGEQVRRNKTQMAGGGRGYGELSEALKGEFPQPLKQAGETGAGWLQVLVDK